MSVQSIPTFHEVGMNSLTVNWHSAADNLQRVCHLLHHLFRRQIGSMKDNRKVSQPDLFQTAFDHVERRFFFGDKQDAAARGS
jgi:hypothetical protein